ncbi:MAG: hypothetical protein ACOY90_15650 [Candidatus Zhuqueibacterota bacterium]
MVVGGGLIPGKYNPTVEKSAKDATTGGVIAGYSVVTVKGKLFYGSSIPDDNGKILFVPFPHTSDITEMNRDKRLEIMELLSAGVEI